MKRILITGVGGYIGVPLCEHLLSKGYSVVGIDRYFFGREKLGKLLNDPDFTAVTADIRDFEIEILQDVDAVIDLAGLSNDASAEIDPDLTEQINYEGSLRVAQAAKKHGVRRYVYSSSAAVYGAGEKKALTESDECRPQTAYARSKLRVERALHELDCSSFQTVIFRNATVFGLAPRMRFDLAINIMTLRAWRDRVIFIMGGGEQWRPFVHVNDVVRALVMGLEESVEKVAGEVFNVGANRMNYQISQLAQFVHDVIPNVTVHNIPDDPDKRTYNVSFDKISSTLGFEPSIWVHEGIVEIKRALERGLISCDDPTCFTLEWYKSLIEWEKRIKELSHNGRIL